MAPFIRAAAIALVALAVAAGPAATPASAETKQCGGRGRPACSILRPTDIAVGTEETHRLGPACVVLVGGFASTSGDQAFDDLLGWTRDDPLYRPLHFGASRSERFQYDTSGPIDRSAEDLGLFVRSLKGECSAFHLITHSRQGGVKDGAAACHSSATRAGCDRLERSRSWISQRKTRRPRHRRSSGSRDGHRQAHPRRARRALLAVDQRLPGRLHHAR